MHSMRDSNYFTKTTIEIVVPLTKAEVFSEKKISRVLIIFFLIIL